MKRLLHIMMLLAMGYAAGEAKEIKTVDDLVGQYVNKTTSMIEDPRYEGSSVTIHATANKDSIIIYNLFDYGTELKAKVDLTDMSITIPSQLFYTDTNYGESDFTNIKLTSTTLDPDRQTPVKGSIDPATGIITLDSWAVYINSGTYADHYFDVVEQTRIIPANGIMRNSYFAGSDGKPQYDDDELNVYMHMNETGDSLIVENFGDHGMDVAIKLNGDKTVNVPRQKYYDADDEKYGDFYTQAADWTKDSPYLSTGISGTWNEDGVTLNGWTGSCLGGYYMGKIAKTVLSFTDGTKLSVSTGISKPQTLGEKAVATEYYNIDGSRLDAPQKGTNVVVRKFADGKTQTFKAILR